MKNLKGDRMEFNTESLKKLKEDIQMALLPVEETAHILVELGRIAYNGSQCELKLTIYRKDEAEADAKKCYDSVKGRIVYRLINLSRNKQLLTNVPFLKYLDFAIVFYLIDGVKADGERLIYDSDLVRWGIKKEELLHLARENTPRLHCAQINTLYGVLNELDKEFGLGFVESSSLIDTKLPCYILTNAFNQYGAVCILYDKVLKSLAENLGKDLVLLPSSIHEFLILPYDLEETDLDELRETVKSVNINNVSSKEYLSDEIYLYWRQTDTVELVKKKE